MDLIHPNTKYQLLVENLPKVDGATGGLLQNSPIVCGGSNHNDYRYYKDCVVIGQPEMEIKMIEKRFGAASVTLDQRKFWVVGGRDEYFDDLSSTEFIELGQPSVKGPNLPFTISSHSMIQYDEKSIYIIGGNQNCSIWSNKTWIVDLKNGFQIKEGPSLNKGRRDHNCAKMTLNGRTILVVAGGEGENFKKLDSVEILDPSKNNIWTPGLYLKSITVKCLFNLSLFVFQDQICHWNYMDMQW